jgi:hypothetical protein
MRFCIFYRLLFWVVVSWKFILHLDSFHNAKYVFFILPPFKFSTKIYNTIRADPLPFWRKMFKIDGDFPKIWVWAPYLAPSFPKFWIRLWILQIDYSWSVKRIEKEKIYFKNPASRWLCCTCMYMQYFFSKLIFSIMPVLYFYKGCFMFSFFFYIF